MAVETAAAGAEVGLIRNLASGCGGFSESGCVGFAGRAAMDWFSTYLVNISSRFVSHIVKRRVLIELAKPLMVRSKVFDSQVGQNIESCSRTSTGTFLKCSHDKTIHDIEKRIADITSLPAEHGEDLYILHYEVGKKFEPHHDYYEDDANTKNGGQRIATLLMHLSDVEEGGETVFPSAKANRSSVPGYIRLFKCVKKGLGGKPKMGDALLFWSVKPDGSVDPSSLHGSCPVVKGNKWASIKLLDANEI